MTDDAVMANMKLQRYDAVNDCYDCGCSKRGQRWFLCSYHEGYGDGFDTAEIEVSRLRAELVSAREDIADRDAVIDQVCIHGLLLAVPCFQCSEYAACSRLDGNSRFIPWAPVLDTPPGDNGE